jgi:hypothetical protein
VKQSDLGEYEENAREKPKYTICRIEHQLPLKPSYMDDKHQFPLQISKLRRIKGFAKNVSQLSLGVYVSHLNVSLLYMISHEVVSSLNISHLFMKD